MSTRFASFHDYLHHPREHSNRAFRRLHATGIALAIVSLSRW